MSHTAIVFTDDSSTFWYEGKLWNMCLSYVCVCVCIHTRTHIYMSIYKLSEENGGEVVLKQKKCNICNKYNKVIYEMNKYLDHVNIYLNLRINQVTKI